MLHIIITSVESLIDVEHLLTVLILKRLVKDAQHLVKSVVYLTMQTRYLHDDAVVGQAVDEGIRNSFRHQTAIVVVTLMVYIEHGFLDIAHLMPQQVDCHCRQCMTVVAVGHDVLGVLILYTQILAEAQRLCLEPRLL